METFLVGVVRHWRDSTSQLESKAEASQQTDWCAPASLLSATTKRFTQPRSCPTLQTILLQLPTSNVWPGLQTKTTFHNLMLYWFTWTNIPSQLYMFQTGQGTKNTTVEVKDVLRPWDQAWGKLATDIINQCKDLWQKLYKKVQGVSRSSTWFNTASIASSFKWMRVMFVGLRGKVLEAAYNVILM